MGTVFIRPQGAHKMRRAVCQFCESPKRSQAVSYSSLQRPSLRQALQEPACHASNTQFEKDFTQALAPRPFVARSLEPRRLASSISNAKSTLSGIKEKCESIQQSDKAASEEDVVALLQQCLHIVESFVKIQEPHEKEKSNATSSLLDLEEKAGKKRMPKKEERRTVDVISQLATELLLDDKVFISADVLELYTKIQVLLKRADYFPQIFSMYANKPIPEANTSPVQFRQQNPKDIKNAVPSDLANSALDIALEQKNLSLALAIIDTSFCAPAFNKAKLFKKAALPITGLATAPLASYVVATWAANMQNTMDPSMATGIAFTATLAYMGFTSSVGVIAIATSNDQMERVTWAPGIPLRHRWLREEERGALDRVAVAWGFKNPWKRGEEEGEEWDSLREFIGMRGMILDKTELMEGME
ncbi:hypothetical protein UA08_04583 [Talaromyces atroroseus]|uniref:Uncharacterized protein n=1 Tax=Talaromyces atroroseus TaxID=1441469 RepID=A0A225AFX8_TALAT|nr:hypothetical protein UA08_04583 [Talaromyces atroroseus]OKL60251.1 hypothetical protein UA08_04583 [Talaromyces atroroseus]